MPSSSIPPGLDYLTHVDQLIVQQQIDMIEMFTGWETKNRYVVKNIRGETVYYAVEENNLITMNYLGSERPFDILVMDNMRAVVLRVNRPFQPNGFACCGLVQEIQIASGVGQLLGSVVQEYDPCAKRFIVRNAQGENVFRIEGPACTIGWVNTDFNIFTVGENVNIGAITRQFPGFYQEMYTHADVFGVRFPRDLAVAMKAVLFGATFLIDFMYYERKAGTPLRDRQRQRWEDNNRNDNSFGHHRRHHHHGFRSNFDSDRSDRNDRDRGFGDRGNDFGRDIPSAGFGMMGPPEIRMPEMRPMDMGPSMDFGMNSGFGGMSTGFGGMSSGFGGNSFNMDF